MHGISQTSPQGCPARACVWAWNSTMQTPPLARESVCHSSRLAMERLTWWCSVAVHSGSSPAWVSTSDTRHRPSSSSVVPASHQGRVKALGTGHRWGECPSQVSIKRLGGSQEIVPEAITLIWAICLREFARRELKWPNRHSDDTIHICCAQASVQDHH